MAFANFGRQLGAFLCRHGTVIAVRSGDFGELEPEADGIHHAVIDRLLLRAGGWRGLQEGHPKSFRHAGRPNRIGGRHVVSKLKTVMIGRVKNCARCDATGQLEPPFVRSFFDRSRGPQCQPGKMICSCPARKQQKLSDVFSTNASHRVKRPPRVSRKTHRRANFFQRLFLRRRGCRRRGDTIW